jgi:hypothetical protein
MRQRANEADPMAEVEVRITWRQWHDGRWEAWITDASGRPPHLVRDRAELERFLSEAYRTRHRGSRGGYDPDRA